MNHSDIKRAWHESQNARLALDSLLRQAPASVCMEYRNKYRQENPNRGYWIRLTSGRTLTNRKPAARKAARKPKLDAIRQQAGACNVKAMMIRQGVQTWR